MKFLLTNFIPANISNHLPIFDLFDVQLNNDKRLVASSLNRFKCVLNKIYCKDNLMAHDWFFINNNSDINNDLCYPVTVIDQYNLNMSWITQLLLHSSKWKNKLYVEAVKRK